MKLLFIIDPIETLNPKKDTSLALMQRAEALGYAVSYATQEDLYMKEAKLWVQETPISDFHTIFMRKDPPVDLEYIYTTILLEQAQREGVRVVNDPKALRDCNEKLFTLYFPKLCPKTLVSKDIEKLKAFWKEEKSLIFKPLDSMGGGSIFHVDEQGANLPVILEMLTFNGTKTIMAQEYIPEIKTKGDKRILLLCGEPAPFALARYPAKEDIRGNLAKGAQGIVEPLTEKDYMLCKEIAPTLKAKGLDFVGLDVIGDYITEINVTSPTCLKEIEAATGLDLAGDFLKKILK